MASSNMGARPPELKTATVVRLPTAAPRKVRQHWNRRTGELRKQLPQFPSARALWPEQRRAVESARLIRDMGRTPELVIATAIYRALGKMDRAKVRAFVAILSITDRESGSAALEWLKVLDGDNSGQVKRALERLESGEWE
jgi:hypothetical protein